MATKVDNLYIKLVEGKIAQLDESDLSLIPTAIAEVYKEIPNMTQDELFCLSSIFIDGSGWMNPKVGADKLEIFQQHLKDISNDVWTLSSATSIRIQPDISKEELQAIAAQNKADENATTTNTTNVVNVIAEETKPTSSSDDGRPWWHYAVGVAAIGAVCYIGYNKFYNDDNDVIVIGDDLW